MKAYSLTPLIAISLMAAAFAAPPAATPKLGDYKNAKKDAIPGNTYGTFSFADAQKEAEKKKKPLIFLVTDERADDAAVKKAGVKAFWALEDDGIVVVLRASTAGEWARLPDPVQKGIKSPVMGKEYPRLLAATEDGATILAGIPSGKVVTLSDKELNKFGKELKKLNGTKTPSTEFPPPAAEEVKPAAPAKTADGKPAATPPAATPPPAPVGPVAIKDAKIEAWTNTDGKAIQAALVEVNGDNITFQMNGKAIPYPLSKLSPASQKRVEELKTANAPK